MVARLDSPANQRAGSRPARAGAIVVALDDSRHPNTDDYRYVSSRTALPVNKARWILYAIALKVGLYLFVVFQANMNYPKEKHYFGREDGDTGSYFVPAENLLRNGDYVGDYAIPGSWAGRMPGYAGVYLAFRSFLDEGAARTALIALQVFLDGLAVFYLSALAFLIYGSRRLFFLVFWFYGLSSYVSQWNFYWMTESLATSLSVFALYTLWRYRTEQGEQGLAWLWGSGALATLWVFLRSFTVPMLAPMVLFIWCSVRKSAPARTLFKRRLIAVGVFLSPFFVVEGAWIARNYTIFERVVPLQVNRWAGYPTSQAEKASFGFAQAIGEDFAYWSNGTFGAWLYEEADFRSDQFRFGEHAFSEDFGLQDLERTKRRFRRARRLRDPKLRTQLDQLAASEFSAYTESYRNQRPFDYFVMSGVRYLSLYLIHPGPQKLPFKAFRQLYRDPPALVVKLVGCLLFQLAVWAGLWGMLRRGPGELWRTMVVSSIVLHVALLIPFVLRYSEARLLVLAYPFLCLSAGRELDWLLERRHKHRTPSEN